MGTRIQSQPAHRGVWHHGRSGQPDGLARALTDDEKVKNILRDLQRELFTVAAELATDPEKYDLFHQHFKPVTEEMVDNLEETIDELETHFQMPQVFILPAALRHRRRWTRPAP